MEQFNNDDLEYIVGDFYDISDFEDDEFFPHDQPERAAHFDSPDSDFEDDFETVYCLLLN